MTACLGLALTLVSAGCGPTPIAGGTPGVVHVAGGTLADVQVHLHRLEGGLPARVGSGVTNVRGEFDCIRADGSGPLRLEPGDYVFTLESVGPTPLLWPPEYTDASKTPLKKTWAAADTRLEVHVPEPRMGH